MKIYAIIVTYNAMRRNWIDRCLKSLQESTVPVTAIVVDNCSTDGTREHVPSQYPDTVWLPQDKNLGFGQANNVGIRYAMSNNADYVLLLNQDASIHPEGIEHLLKACDGESLYSPLHYNGDGSSPDKMFGNTKLHNGGLLFDALQTGQDMPDCIESGEVCAACWFMPVSLIRKVGGFNPLFFQYSEDNNYYQRMVYHHIKTYVVPHARMFHDRNLHGNIQVYNKNQIFREMLLTVNDINRPAFKVATGVVRLCWRCYTHYLPQKAYKPGTFTAAFFKVIGMASAIYQSRKKEKEQGLTWL